jgi:hypothetical protein
MFRWCKMFSYITNDIQVYTPALEICQYLFIIVLKLESWKRTVVIGSRTDTHGQMGILLSLKLRQWI